MVKRDRLIWPQAKALEEAELIRRGRHADPLRRKGLAISGGGIRSATFALGVLEALKANDKLHDLAYLSTVSGGGYVGSWLSANCSRHPGWLRPAARWKESIDHLRRYSNYLSPQVGFFSADTWSMATIWLRNTMLVQTTVILAMACALIVPRVLLGPFLGWPSVGNWRWLTILLFVFGAVGIAGNQIRMTGHTKLWFLKGDKWVPCAVVAAVTLILTLAYALAIDFEPFRGGPINYWEAGPIAIGLVIGTFALQPVAVNVAAAVNRLFHQPPPVEVNYTQAWVQGAVVIPLMVSGFLVAAILWGESVGVSAATAVNGVDPFALSKLDTYGEFFLNAWRYWPFPLSVVFVSLILLALSSATWSASNWWQGPAVAFLAAGVGMLMLHALLCAVMLLLHGWAVDGGAWKAFVWAPPLVAGSFVLTLGVLVGILSRQSTEGVREWWSRLGAWLGIYAAAWMIISVVAVYSRMWVDEIAKNLPAALAASGGWIATTLGGLLAGNSASTTGAEKSKSTTTKLKEALLGVAPLLFIFGLLIAVAFVVDYVVQINAEVTWYTLKEPGHVAAFTTSSWWMLIGCAVALALFAWRVDINEFSLNAFYRHRLVRCYLGASRFDKGERHTQNFTGFDDADDVPLATLTGGFVTGPYHIVNCALNLGGSSDLALHSRHSASFTLTPITCGSGYEASFPNGDVSEVGFVCTSEYGGADDAPTLGQAISVSGAAASPNMGYHTSPLVAFLLTVFNLRLGWWFPNPLRSRTNRPSPRFNFNCLVSELFGGANDTSNFLMVSDGGHFENLAAYELVKRRCGTIVISDGECDPDLTFAGLGTLIRMCEVDFGVKIVLDVKGINGTAAAARHAVGHIEWGDGSPNGTLVYLKASLNDSEGTPIRQYKASHPTFPHESTGDQFYTEDQFESYRHLGQEIAQGAVTAGHF